MKRRVSKLAVSFLISYIVILLIPMFLSLRPINTARRNLFNKVEELNSSALDQASSVVESVFDSALGTMFGLSQSENIRKLFYVETPLNNINRTDIYLALQSDIKQARADGPISYECAVFFAGGEFLLGQTARYTPKAMYEQMFSSSGYTYDQVMEILTTCHRQEIYDMGGSLMLIHSYPFTGSTVKANLIALIQKNSIYSKLQQNGWVRDGSFTVYNFDGKPLLSIGDKSRREIGLSTEKSGKWLARYTLSVPESLAWGKISRSLTISYIIYFGCALLFGGLIALLFTYRNYQPIKRIIHVLNNTSGNFSEMPDGELDHIYTSVNQMISGNAEMKKQLEIRNEYMRRDFISKLLRGRLEFKEIDEERLKSYDIDFPYEHFIIFLVSHTENPAADHSATFMLAERMNHKYTSYVCETNEYSACVVNFENPADAAEVIVTFRQALTTVENELALTVRAACSEIHTSYAGIHNGYEEASYAIDLTQEGKFTSYMPPDEKQYGYTPDMEQALLRALKMDDRTEAGRVLNEVFVKSKGCALHELKLMVFSIENSLTTLLEGIQGSESEVDVLQSANEISRLNSMNSIREYTEKRVNHIIEVRKTHFEKQGSKLIDSIRAYVSSHVSDTELSNTVISDSLNISASYLSRVFKQETGENLLDYINCTRISRACEIMNLQPDKSLKDVCESVGYSNMTTFTRMFKKYAGVTPGKYLP